MRMLSKLAAAIAAAGATTLLVAGPAMADPPSGVTPRVSDVVGVGSATTQFMLDQLSTDYNSQHATASTKLYSWDAVPLGSLITSKSAPNCTNTTRPTGSSQGIGSSNPVPLSLEQNTTVTGGTGFCTDFARSS